MSSVRGSKARTAANRGSRRKVALYRDTETPGVFIAVVKDGQTVAIPNGLSKPRVVGTNQWGGVVAANGDVTLQSGTYVAVFQKADGSLQILTLYRPQGGWAWINQHRLAGPNPQWAIDTFLPE
jgi:hypothetical protein